MGQSRSLLQLQMKKNLHPIPMRRILLLMSISLNGWMAAQAPKLFITIISHNEDNIGYNSSSTLYYNNRAALVNTCNMFDTKGVKYNYGGEYIALEAIADLDTGTVLTNTNGKNILRWIVEDKGFECDPHSHESSRNYADVHYLMSNLGITPTNTMSGFLYDTLQNGNAWSDYQNGVTGIYFPSHTWYPEVLWGAATMMHTHDPHFWGLFKPAHMDTFFVHNPSNTLKVVGTGCPIKIESTTTIQYVDSLIDQIVYDLQNGFLPAGGIYTQEIFFSEGKVNQPWFFPMISRVIDSVNVHVAQGTVEWKSLDEIVNYWETTYASVPFAVDCDHNSLLGNEENPLHILPPIKIYPNPVTDELVIESGVSVIEKIEIFSSLGSKVLCSTGPISSILHLAHLPKGIYFIKIKLEKSDPWSIHKIIKN